MGPLALVCGSPCSRRGHLKKKKNRIGPEERARTQSGTLWRRARNDRARVVVPRRRQKETLSDSHAGGEWHHWHHDADAARLREADGGADERLLLFIRIVQVSSVFPVSLRFGYDQSCEKPRDTLRVRFELSLYCPKSRPLCVCVKIQIVSIDIPVVNGLGEDGGAPRRATARRRASGTTARQHALRRRRAALWPRPLFAKH